MTIFAYLALLGWIPAILVMFSVLPRRLAATTAVVGAWLILPPYSFPIGALPDYSKTMAASLGVALGTLIFCPDRILMFRPRWFDLPMLLWCFSGTASSLQNGLGLYDGLSDALGSVLLWGLPYLIGRLHFGDPESLRYFAVTLTVGGLSYILPCVWEMKMSPVLLARIYGAADRSGFVKGVRLGGYRPQVFFWTGLELGLWMMAASLTGWWLWRCGALKKIGQTRFGPVLLPTLVATTILCRSTGAIALLVAGVMTLWLSVQLRTRLILASLLLVGPLYVAVRTSNVWSGEQAVALAERLVGRDRAQSLQYRIDCEALLMARALKQPLWGWGGWGRSSVYTDPEMPWRKKVVTDSMWIIYLGTKGFVGLALFYVAMALPAIRFLLRFPARQWNDSRLAAASLTAVLLGLYLIDCLLNAFPNMIYITLAGGLMGLEPKQLRTMTTWRGRKTADQAGIAPAADIGAITLAADRNLRLGRTFKAEGRLKEAETAWSSTLDLVGTLIAAYPDDLDLRRRWCDCANDLAWMMLHDRQPAHVDLSGAIALARHAVDMCPDGATYWNTLGTAYFRAGDDAVAIATLDHAMALGGGTAFDNVFLAMAHARSGNPERAEHLLAQTMVQIDRDSPGHPELIRFCNEARLILAERSRTAAVAH